VMRFKEPLLLIVWMTLDIYCSDFLNRDNKAVSTAIADVCEEFYIKKSINFDVILYGVETDNLKDIIDIFLNKIGNRTVLTFKHVKDINKWDHKIEKSAVLFFKNEFLVWEFHRNVSFERRFPTELTFLIFSEEVLTIEPYISLYNTDVTNFNSYEFFFSNFPRQIDFFTYENFEVGRCNKPTRIVLNTFYKSTKIWQNELKIHKKFQNFHNCTLAVIEPYGPSLYLNEGNSKIADCLIKDPLSCLGIATETAEQVGTQGFTVDIYKILSKILNFNPIYRFTMTNYTPLELMPYPKLTFFTGSLSSEETNLGFITPLVFEAHFLLAVTPSEFYTNYEKLWLPFDVFTWIFLLLTFLVAFIVTFVVKFIPKIVRNSLFGREVLTPTLNIFHIFFGISQMKLPSDSVPRFILMLFITFCLIFRTCYQSKLFEFMTSDMRKPPPSTVEELIERNYTIVSCDGLENELRRTIPENILR